MAEAKAVPRNQFLDIASTLGALAPLFLGTKGSSTTTSKTGTISPTANAHMEELLATLMPQITGTAQADAVVQNILMKAKEAFAPVLGNEKKAGLYNSTMLQELAGRSVARATGEASAAVLQSQQKAADTAASLINTNTAATAGSSTTATNSGVKPSISSKLTSGLALAATLKSLLGGGGKDGGDFISNLLGIGKGKITDLFKKPDDEAAAPIYDAMSNGGSVSEFFSGVGGSGTATTNSLSSSITSMGDANAGFNASSVLTPAFDNTTLYGSAINPSGATSLTEAATLATADPVEALVQQTLADIAAAGGGATTGPTGDAAQAVDGFDDGFTSRGVPDNPVTGTEPVSAVGATPIDVAAIAGGGAGGAAASATSAVPVATLADAAPAVYHTAYSGSGLTAAESDAAASTMSSEQVATYNSLAPELGVEQMAAAPVSESGVMGWSAAAPDIATESVAATGADFGSAFAASAEASAGEAAASAALPSVMGTLGPIAAFFAGANALSSLTTKPERPQRTLKTEDQPDGGYINTVQFMDTGEIIAIPYSNPNEPDQRSQGAGIRKGSGEE